MPGRFVEPPMRASLPCILSDPFVSSRASSHYFRALDILQTPAASGFLDPCICEGLRFVSASGSPHRTIFQSQAHALPLSLVKAPGTGLGRGWAMKRVGRVHWLIRVIAFLVLLGLPAVVHGGNRPTVASRADCGKCKGTPPTIQVVPASLPVRPADVPRIRPEVRSPGRNESSQDRRPGTPVPSCDEFGRVMLKPAPGPSLAR